MTVPEAKRRFSILIINPNTSTHMTDALKPILDSLQYTDIQFDYFTAPSEPATLPDGSFVHGIASINNCDDSAQSAVHCKPFLEPLVPEYDAFLVACYSAHPLVGILKEKVRKLEETNLPSRLSISRSQRKYVTGIFEATVMTSLSLISSFHLEDEVELRKSQAKDTFGIISTGDAWKTELNNAVKKLLVGPEDEKASTTRFAGVETTGLSAIELHTTPPDEVNRRLGEATERLIKSSTYPVSAICMGCAGMAGMEEAVRAGCVSAYGDRQGNRVRIVDGVVAGAGMLVNACKAGF